jgi:hypothetical protein
MMLARLSLYQKPTRRETISQEPTMLQINNAVANNAVAD